eukprot:gene4856-9680_t
MGTDLKKHQAKEYEVDARPIITLCNPAIQIGDMDQFVSIWMDVQTVLGPAPPPLVRLGGGEVWVHTDEERSISGVRRRGLRKLRVFLDEHVGEGADTYMENWTDISKGRRLVMYMDVFLAGEGVSFFDSDLVEKGERRGRMATDEVRKAQSRSAEGSFLDAKSMGRQGVGSEGSVTRYGTVPGLWATSRKCYLCRKESGGSLHPSSLSFL